MQLRSVYEFVQGLRAFTSLSEQQIEKLAQKIDTQAPKELITDDEVRRYVAAAQKGSRRYTAQERAVAPSVQAMRAMLNKSAAAMKTIKLDGLEDMKRLKVPQQVPLEKIKGHFTLDSREVIVGTSIGDLLERRTPVVSLHDFAKKLAKGSPNLSLHALVKELKKDDNYDDYLVINAILERYFLGRDVEEGDKQLHIHQGPGGTIVSNVERSFDVYNTKIDVNLRPNIEVRGQPGDIVVMKSSLPGTEPEITTLREGRGAKFPWWRDRNAPSTLRIVIARPDENGDEPKIIEAINLVIPTNVAHVTAKPPRSAKV